MEFRGLATTPKSAQYHLTHVNSQMTVSESRCTKNTRQATSVSKCKKVRLNSTGMHEYRCAQKGRTLCCQGHHSPRCIPKETFPEFNQSLYTRSKSVNGNLQQLFTAKQHPCHFYPFVKCSIASSTACPYPRPNCHWPLYDSPPFQSAPESIMFHGKTCRSRSRSLRCDLGKQMRLSQLKVC
jgi:hypothetical protein